MGKNINITNFKKGDIVMSLFTGSIFEVTRVAITHLKARKITGAQDDFTFFLKYDSVVLVNKWREITI